MYINLLPITAVVAINLFILKELWEFYKKRQNEKKQLLAYKLLLIEELKENLFVYETVDHLALQVMYIIKNPNENVEYRVERDRYGNEYIHISKGNCFEDGFLNRSLIQNFKWEIYESIFKELIVLDENLYQKLKALYDKFKYFQKTRNMLILYLSDEPNIGVQNFMEPGIEGLSSKTDREIVHKQMIDIYKLLSNEKDCEIHHKKFFTDKEFIEFFKS